MGGGGSDAQDIENQRRADEEKRKKDIAFGIRQVNRTFGNLLNPQDAEAGGMFTVSKRPPRTLKGGPEFAVLNPQGKVVGVYPTYDAAIAEADKRGPRAGALDFTNSSFLDQLQADYLGFATPEVGRQATDATEKVTKQLARRGTGESSMANDQAAEIARQQGEALARVNARAEEIRAERARGIEASRQGIISQLEASANAPAAAQSAINEAANLSAAQEFSPIGEVFNVGLGTGADVLRLQSTPGASPTIFSRRKKGSQKVIE